MNGSGNLEYTHRAYLCLGSNINPYDNLREAIRRLRQHARLVSLSTCWETEAVGSRGPNFLNIGACIATSMMPETLKIQLLRPVEAELGRVRGADKYAPRTIDLDITVFDGQVLDPEIWRRVYLALIFAELLPDLRNPETGETLPETAARLKAGMLAIPHASPEDFLKQIG